MKWLFRVLVLALAAAVLSAAPAFADIAGPMGMRFGTYMTLMTVLIVAVVVIVLAVLIRVILTLRKKRRDSETNGGNGK